MVTIDKNFELCFFSANIKCNTGKEEVFSMKEYKVFKKQNNI